MVRIKYVEEPRVSPQKRKGKQKEMESPPPSPTSLVVNSPRRTLSLLRERRHKHPALDPDKKPTVSFAAGFAEEHGPKPSEVYGFVGSITTVLAAGSCHTKPSFS